MFKLMELPRGKNVLKNKLVYRVKSEGQEVKLRYKTQFFEGIRSNKGS
jgi:hypothetical protein